MILKPLDCSVGSVLWIVVMLKDHLGWVKVVPVDGLLQFIAKDVAVELRIEGSINFGQKSWTLSSHASPHHQRSSTMLDCGLNCPIGHWLTLSLPAPFASVRSKSIDFHFVQPNDSLPVLHCPVLVLPCKVEPCPDMLWLQERLFWLHC